MRDWSERYWHGDGAEPRLLLPGRDSEDRGRARLAAVGALLYHLGLILVAANLKLGSLRFEVRPEPPLLARRVTPLIVPKDVPSFKVTQKEPARGKAADEITLEALRAREAVRQPRQAPPGRPFEAPRQVVQSGAAAPALEAPRVETPQQGLPNVPNLNAMKMPGAPPPPPDAPKANPFEKVGPSAGTPTGRGLGQIPKPGTDEMLKAVVRAGGKGTVVTDSGMGGSGGISEGIIQNQARIPAASALELISDPQGIDFRPYLIQVLSAVKRNWQAVYPESARLGRQGRTTIQFSIDRQGKIPKLVVAVPSGTEGLDRAAVAGISASYPFPPLPAEFKGAEIRLQLVFSYNMPR